MKAFRQGRLPGTTPRSGNAAEGAMFARRGCSTCHGPTGEEGPSIALVGGDVTTFTNYWPIRHWPFAPSIWDYIRRVMPYDRPGHPHRRRGLRADRVPPLSKRHHLRGRRHGRADPAAGPDAAPRRLRDARHLDAGDAARVPDRAGSVSSRRRVRAAAGAPKRGVGISFMVADCHENKR